MKKCNCGSSTARTHMVPHHTIEKLVERGKKKVGAGKAKLDQRLIVADHRNLLATSADQGKSGCVHFDIFGTVEAHLCWEFTKFEIGTSVVDVEIKLRAGIGADEVLQGILKLQCDSVSAPQSCKVSFTPSDQSQDVFAATKDTWWKCLIECAPQCVHCLTDYWCWIACALPCVIKCFL